MARRYTRRFLRRRGGFIPGAGLRRAKSLSRNRLSSRTSDFYARPTSRPKLSVPSIARTRMTSRSLSTATKAKMKRMPKPQTSTARKTRTADDRAIKVVNTMRRMYRRPTGMRRKPSTSMEYTRTPAEGNSTSYFTRKALRLRGFKKRMLRNSPLQVRRSDTTHNLSWAYGRQGVLVLLNNTTTELQTIANLIPGALGTGGNTQQMLLQSTKMHHIISSGSKAGIKLRIYEGCYKRDVEAAFGPTTLWANGMLDTGSTETPFDIDSKPWTSPQFNQLCHISKVTNLFLPQGRTHEHYVTYNYNRIHSKEIGNTSGDRDYLKGWTRFTMFVAYGEPVADTDADITTASGRIIMCSTKTQRYRYNTPTVYGGSYNRGIPIVGVTQERLLDEGAGEIEVNTVL